MIRKRAWEIGSAALFLLTIAGVVGGWFAWRERQRRLDRELSTFLFNSDPKSAGDHARIRGLLRQGASIRAESASGWTVPMEAVAANDVPLVRQLLARGLDVNASGPNGWTPLMVAAQFDSVEAAQVLLEHGAAVNRWDSGYTALGWAKLFSASPRMIRLLRQHGAKE